MFGGIEYKKYSESESKDVPGHYFDSGVYRLSDQLFTSSSFSGKERLEVEVTGRIKHSGEIVYVIRYNGKTYAVKDNDELNGFLFKYEDGHAYLINSGNILSVQAKDEPFSSELKPDKSIKNGEKVVLDDAVYSSLRNPVNFLRHFEIKMVGNKGRNIGFYLKSKGDLKLSDLGLYETDMITHVNGRPVPIISRNPSEVLSILRMDSWDIKILRDYEVLDFILEIK
ncbi:MAG: hypothetical protein IBX55_01200 [Methyloprofundus sp.]|nr:hypothetical protein [Methyloprofundus sp.]